MNPNFIHLLIFKGLNLKLNPPEHNCHTYDLMKNKKCAKFYRNGN